MSEHLNGNGAAAKSRFDELDQAVFDQLGEAAIEAQVRNFPFLTFALPSTTGTPEWRVNEEIVTDALALAIVDEVAWGWSRFKAKKMVEEHWSKALGFRKPPRPNSFTDRAVWERTDGGWPSDPWSFGLKLPLKITSGPLIGKVVILSSRTPDLRDAIADIMLAFRLKRRRPIVKLTVIKAGGSAALLPLLAIESYSDDDTTIKGLNLTKDNTALEADAFKPALQRSSLQMDDDIPF